MLKKYIGTKEFYRTILLIAVPIIIQNSITHFVSLLDNIMVGQLGDPQMSGVSVSNQLMMITNLCIWGASSGAGIFVAQFRGSRDVEGIRNTFRFKILILSLISVVSILVLGIAREPLINLYLTGDGDPVAAQLTLQYGKEYMAIMLVGLIPFAMTNVYASTLRECGNTKVPMYASVSAVFTNLALNYILIFGHFGAPAMGVRGAALATVIARFVEFSIVAVATHYNPEKCPYIKGVYRSFRIPGSLCKNIIVTGMPLLLNEFLWSMSLAIMSQSYSTCGLNVINAVNITNTLNQLVNVATMAVGNTVGILIGQALGAGKSKDEVSDTTAKLLALSVTSGVIFGFVLAGVSGVFPNFYNTTEDVRIIATHLMIITAVLKPLNAYSFSAYFALRSGGHTWITFILDGGYISFITMPVAFLLTRFTSLPIYPVYFACQFVDAIRCILARYLLKKGTWMSRIV